MGVGGLDSAAGGIGEAATALVEGEGGGYRYVALSTPRVAFVLQLAPSVQVIHRIRAHAECPQDVLPCLAWRAALPSPAAPPAAPLTAPGAHDARGRHYAAAAAPPPPLPPSATALGAAGMGTAATASAAAVVSASAASAAAHATGQTAAGPVLAVAWGRQLRLWHLVSPPGGSSGSGGVGGGGGGGGVGGAAGGGDGTDGRGGGVQLVSVAGFESAREIGALSWLPEGFLLVTDAQNPSPSPSLRPNPNPNPFLSLT